MAKTAQEVSPDECARYDLVSHSLGDCSDPQALQAHVGECCLCMEEGEEIQTFFATELVEEVSGVYQGLPLNLVSVPPSLVDFLFPPAAWQRLLNELRDRWTASEQLPLADIAWDVARLKAEGALIPGKRPRYYVGQHLTLKLRIDEDCYVLIFHTDAQGTAKRIFPRQETGDFLQTGTYEFSGLVQGEHDEVQRLIALATKTALEASGVQHEHVDAALVEKLVQEVRTLSPDQWSWSEHEYRVVEAARSSLEDLEESCQSEIRDRADKEKPACEEVCQRTLNSALSSGERREAFQVFYKITPRLVSHWINSWIENIPPEQRQDVEAYIQEVYTRLLAANVKYQGYFPLLRYMREISTRVVLQDYRKLKRSIISSLRPKLRKFQAHAENEEAAKILLNCLRTHGLNDPVDQLLLESLLRGQKTQAVATHPVLSEAFQQSEAKSVEKFIYNRRDTALWHAFKIMRRIQQSAEDQECSTVVRRVLG